MGSFSNLVKYVDIKEVAETCVKPKRTLKNLVITFFKVRQDDKIHVFMSHTSRITGIVPVFLPSSQYPEKPSWDAELFQFLVALLE